MTRAEILKYLDEYKDNALRRDALIADMRRIRAAAEEMDLDDTGPMLHSPVIDGMPHGNALGDITASLGLRLVDGRDLKTERELQQALDEARAEYNAVQYRCAVVESWIDYLTGKYRIVLVKKVINKESWREVAVELFRQTNREYTREGMRRIKGAALKKIFGIAGCGQKEQKEKVGGKLADIWP